MTRSDLLGLGFSSKGIKHRVATGRLHPMANGIYAVGRPELTPNGRWMAAVLVCGDGAALSHRSAAKLWGIGYEDGKRIDVSIRRRSRLERPGIVVHQRAALPEASVVRRFGIPVTHPVQTLIDLATELNCSASSVRSTRRTSWTSSIRRRSGGRSTATAGCPV